MWIARTSGVARRGPPQRQAACPEAAPNILGIVAMMGEQGRGGALDLDLLAAQTLGDRDLERELFGLFEAQAERLLPIIAGPAEPAARSEAAHSLKGASAAVGAVQVMRLAGELEAAFGQGGAEPSAAIALLARAVRDARAAIEAWRHAASSGRDFR
jgi:HPt (histidine-containing phosphotransfer) domain-containing protein